MDDFKTVEGEIVSDDPLLRKQKEGVAAMRTSLLACKDNPGQAVRELTSIRVYHQLTRVVRYIELMDKLEEKLYASIEASALKTNNADPTTWMMLLHIQEQLQDNMIKSHKLLEPYLSEGPMTLTDSLAIEVEADQPQLLDRTSRDKVRSAAQQLLLMMDGESNDS